MDVPKSRSHTETLQTIDTESIGPGVDVAASESYLETLVECQTVEMLILDAQICCG